MDKPRLLFAQTDLQHIDWRKWCKELKEKQKPTNLGYHVPADSNINKNEIIKANWASANGNSYGTHDRSENRPKSILKHLRIYLPATN